VCRKSSFQARSLQARLPVPRIFWILGAAQVPASVARPHCRSQAKQEAISVRATVIEHLRRVPTRAEITAARRVPHRVAACGQATILRAKAPRLDRGGGSTHLALPGGEPLCGAAYPPKSRMRPLQTELAGPPSRW